MDIIRVDWCFENWDSGRRRSREERGTTVSLKSKARLRKRRFETGSSQFPCAFHSNEDKYRNYADAKGGGKIVARVEDRLRSSICPRGRDGWRNEATSRFRFRPRFIKGRIKPAVSQGTRRTVTRDILICILRKFNFSRIFPRAVRAAETRAFSR